MIRKVLLKSGDKIRGRYNIKDLADKMPKEYTPKEENWGEPIGLEVW